MPIQVCKLAHLQKHLLILNFKEKRLEYYDVLDKAHTTGDYTDFVKLVARLEIEMIEMYLKLL